MLQIENFIAALNLTWLRRHGIFYQVLIWQFFYTKGGNYANIKSKEVKNPFCKDLLKSLGIFCRAVAIQTLEDILYSPFWHNSNFQHGQTIYFEGW